MIKVVLTGIWASLIAVGAVFGVLEWQKHSGAGAAPSAGMTLE